MRKFALISAIALFSMTCLSNAAVLELNGTTADLVLSGYDPNGATGLSNGTTVNRLFPSGELYLNSLADVTFTYLGTEAGHTNNFLFEGNSIFDSKNWIVGSSYTANDVAPGRLAFSFLDSDTNASVANGLVGALLYNSLALVLEAGGTWLALFNDDCSCDADFDDMVVRISAVARQREINPVPVPAALPLLASALGAFGFIGWRRRSKANGSARMVRRSVTAASLL